MNQVDASKRFMAFESEESSDNLVMVGGHTWVHRNHNSHNIAVIVGSHAVMVVDTRATPNLPPEVMASIRRVTILPIRYMVLTHYRSVREFPQAIHKGHIPPAIACSADVGVDGKRQATLGAGSVRMSLLENIELGSLKVQIFQLQNGSRLGETVVWVPADQAVVCGNVGNFDHASGQIEPSSVLGSLALEAIAKLQPRILVTARGEVAETLVLSN
jgi:hypothetical protein